MTPTPPLPPLPDPLSIPADAVVTGVTADPDLEYGTIRLDTPSDPHAAWKVELGNEYIGATRSDYRGAALTTELPPGTDDHVRVITFVAALMVQGSPPPYGDPHALPRPDVTDVEMIERDHGGRFDPTSTMFRSVRETRLIERRWTWREGVDYNGAPARPTLSAMDEQYR